MDFPRPVTQRDAVAGVVREMFPPASFPRSTFEQAADDLLTGPWAAPLLHQLENVAGGQADLGPEVATRLLDDIRGTALHAVIRAVAVRSALRQARSERASFDLPSEWRASEVPAEGCR